MDDLSISSKVASSGMKAQATRLRIISENLANADLTSEIPGREPYRRKLITFRNALNKELDADTVKVKKIVNDKTPLKSKYDPAHPGANEEGYVQIPNVNSLVELMDMREAQRSYEANLNVISTSRSMVAKTLELLRDETQEQENAMALIDFNTAINAYQQASGSVKSAVAGKQPAASAFEGEEAFATMVTDSLKQAVQSGQQAEQLSLKQISGEADLKDVVTAVANAEHTLETVVAVRDKVLSAYQEILRMPI